ncbi:methyl-accepting chemotaxis protein [Horticoccus sp. 23ND18S-11]|uniref:methyl-accepting chemotaxis protein n=1 Tax=Horticoccus sp. 23ND18S-11 TaxID=3391832 RepID=UPI0039C9A15D
MFSKLRLRTRLFIAFGVMAVFSLAAGVINFVSVGQLDGQLDKVAGKIVPELRASLEADMAHDAARGALFRTIIGFNAANQEDIAAGVKEFREATALHQKSMDEIVRYTTRADVKAGMALAATGLKEYQTAGERIITLIQQNAGKTELAAAQLEFQRAFDAEADKMEKLSDLIQNEVTTAEKAANGVGDRSKWMAIGSTLAALLSAVLIALGMDRQMSHPLSQAVGALEGASVQVSTASNEITSNGQSLAEATSEQAASLEETSASLEEISAMTKRNADNAASSKALSQQARESAVSGLDRIAAMGRTLTTVKGAVGEMESAVSEMQSSSQEIAKIIKTIDEIAFQTNLLALNAAVEAARAGEAGAGFAVVADEVRSLAQRSAQAAKDTSDKIEAAIRRSEFGGVASAKVVQSLTDVENNAANIGQVFQGIVKQVTSLDEVINQIASASQEQSSGINEVNMAVTQMDKVTQTNAASAQENAAAAHELNRQANTLREIVAQLHSLVAGIGDHPVVAAAVAQQRPEHVSPALVRPAGAPVKKSKPAASAYQNGHNGTNGHGTNGHTNGSGHGHPHGTSSGHTPAGNGMASNGSGAIPMPRLPGIPGGFRDF